MNKILLSFAILGTLTLASCEKIKEVIFPSFETSTGEVTVPIPVIVASNAEVDFGSAEINLNVDSIIRKYTANQFGVDHATSIKVTSVTFDLQDSDALNNFSNLETLRLSVSSSKKPTPIVIANAVITSSASPVVAKGNDVDLREYLKESYITLGLGGKVKNPTTKPLQMTVNVQLKVN